MRKVDDGEEEKTGGKILDVQDVPRNLPLKFHQNWVSNS